MVIGNYVYGKERNRNGWKFLRGCEQQKLKILNTFFKKRKGKLWTWLSPNQEHKNQIDFIQSPLIKNRILDCGTKNFQYHTDHKLLKCKLNTEKVRY